MELWQAEIVNYFDELAVLNQNGVRTLVPSSTIGKLAPQFTAGVRRHWREVVLPVARQTAIKLHRSGYSLLAIAHIGEQQAYAYHAGSEMLCCPIWTYGVWRYGRGHALFNTQGVDERLPRYVVPVQYYVVVSQEEHILLREIAADHDWLCPDGLHNGAQYRIAPWLLSEDLDHADWERVLEGENAFPSGY